MTRVGSLTFAGLFLALGMSSCGRDATQLGASSASLRIEPGSRTLFANQVFSFRVLRAEDGLTTDVTDDPDLRLSVGDAGVVDVQRGQGQAVGPGATELVASLGASSARVRLEVLEDELVGLSVEPSSLRLAVGAEAQLEVTGTLASSQTVDLSSGDEGTQYSVSGTAVRVSPDGLIEAVLPGETSVTVEQVGQQISVDVEVVPLPDDLEALLLEPNPLRLIPNEERRVRVLGDIGDGQPIVLPVDDVSFEIADRSVARVDASGNVRALGLQATTTLTASLGALSASATIEVQRPDATLESLELDPPGGVIEVEERRNLELVARFSDGSARDVATEPESSFSADSDSVTVGDNGLLIGNRAGTATVIGRFGGQQVAGTFEVVGDVSLDRIEVSPSPIALEVDGGIELTVTAFFADGSQSDVTEMTVLASPDNAVEWVPELRTLNGVQTGAGTLQFSFQNTTTIVPFAVIDDFSLVELFFEPDPVSVREGGTAQVQLFARIPSGDTIIANSLPGVSFSVSDPTVAEIGGTPPIQIRGRQVGITRLNASFQALTASVRVEVTPDPDQVVSLLISSPTVIPVAQPFQVQVIGVLADGNSIQLNGEAGLTVSASPAAILSASQNGANIEVRGVRAGSGEIEATFQGLRASRTVQVRPGADPVASIFFAPSSLTLSTGEIGVVLLRARRASGTEFVVGPNSGLALVSDLGINAVQGSSATINVSGTTAGDFRVRAFFQGLSTILPVEILGASTFTSLQINTIFELDLGETADVQVVGTTVNGTQVDLTSTPGLNLFSEDPTVAVVQGPTWEAAGFGSTLLVAQFGMLETTVEVTVREPRTPVLTALVPDLVAIRSLNDPAARVEVRGTDLLPGDTILLDGAPATLVRESTGRIQISIPASQLTARATYDIQARTPQGRLSNILQLEVADPPRIDRSYPTSVVRGGKVRLRLFGEGFENVTVTTPSAATVSDVETGSGGRELSFDVDVPVTLAPGSYLFAVDAVGGTTSVSITVARSASDLTITGTRDENGTLLVEDLTISSSGRLAGNGPQSPLVVVASGDVVIDGEILVSGDSGKAGPTPSGGAGGPGAGGGGAGGSALNMISAPGGSGQPAGLQAATPSGVGTGGGDGGGEGAGEGAPSTMAPICGTSGGGGAGAGPTADGGESRFIAADGGTAPGRSLWGSGAGGGGGNSCGGSAGREPDTAGSGGGGGGLIEIQLTHGGSLTVNGDILARGGDGGDGSAPVANSNGGGAGGGGGGGVIRLITDGGNIIIGPNAELDVRGGRGGRAFGIAIAGGGGGGGIIFFDPRAGTILQQGTVRTQGGLGGSPPGNGQPGILLTAPP